jgi:hypothetical protein
MGLTARTTVLGGGALGLGALVVFSGCTWERLDQQRRKETTRDGLFFFQAIRGRGWARDGFLFFHYRCFKVGQNSRTP